MNPSPTITLKDVLSSMERGERFDIAYVTADRKRGTGGEIKALAGCVLHREGLGKSSQKPAPESAFRAAGPATPEAATGKAPSHHAHSTRNVYVLQTREIRKVHIRLITRFNGRRVL